MGESEGRVVGPEEGDHHVIVGGDQVTITVVRNAEAACLPAHINMC